MTDSVVDFLFKYAAGPIFGLLGYMWKKQEDSVKVLDQTHKDRIEALRKEHGEKLEHLTRETDRNRDISAKIFDKLDGMSKDSAERHLTLVNLVHSGLAGKVDK